jgi:hypothetical protein
MSGTQEERIKLLKSGCSGKELEKLFIESKDFRLVFEKTIRYNKDSYVIG